MDSTEKGENAHIKLKKPQVHESTFGSVRTQKQGIQGYNLYKISKAGVV